MLSGRLAAHHRQQLLDLCSLLLNPSPQVGHLLARSAPQATHAQPQRSEVVVNKAPVTPPDGLKVGDNCYAIGKLMTERWFAAKLLKIPPRLPQSLPLASLGGLPRGM